MENPDSSLFVPPLYHVITHTDVVKLGIIFNSLVEAVEEHPDAYIKFVAEQLEMILKSID